MIKNGGMPVHNPDRHVASLRDNEAEIDIPASQAAPYPCPCPGLVFHEASTRIGNSLNPSAGVWAEAHYCKAAFGRDNIFFR